ncbi:MAG: esterase-like activity of phytase family protein [bacterium]
MKKIVISVSLVLSICAHAQEIKLVKYELKTPPVIGAHDGVTICEGGISGLHFIRGSENEFYLITDRGPNADANEANAGKETILFAFPDYAPKVFKARAEGDSLRVMETFTLKKSGGTNASGIPHPAGLGNSGEVAWVDTNKTLANLDEWGIDSECIVADQNGDFWIGDEYGPTIWHVNGKTGEVIKRYTPFGASQHEMAIDSVLAKRRPNRGFEGIACTPNGKVYALLQAPMYNPDKAAGEASRLQRILEIDPKTHATSMFVYEHEAPTASLKNKEWSIGDMTAINDHEFLVIEHAAKKDENVKKIFKIDISQATPITREDFNGKTLEQLENAEICVANGIKPVQKTLYMDLLANGWDASHKKPEGLTVVNDTTIAVINDNDFGVDSPKADGVLVNTGKKTVLYYFTVPKSMALSFVVQGGKAATK